MTAELGREDHAWFDAQRRAYFPPERNQLSAHLTMFHALPPMVEAEVRDLLKALLAAPPPAAMLDGLINLGGGVAYRIRSEGLEEKREAIAARFTGMLTQQDQAGWRPHITVQNKVAAKEARLLLQRLEQDFMPRAVAIHGLALHAYDGGPWEALGRWAFRY